MKTCRHVVEVRWSDCDMNGHVRHNAYADFCTHARIQWLRSQGFGFDTLVEQQFGPVIFKEWTEYVKEAKLSEHVAVVVRMAGLSEDGSRFRIHHEVYREDGRLAARHGIDGAWLNLATRKLMPPPKALADIFADLERTPGFETLA
jgi:acyl-CoA thioester hydrolase